MTQASWGLASLLCWCSIYICHAFGEVRLDFSWRFRILFLFLHYLPSFDFLLCQ